MGNPNFLFKFSSAKNAAKILDGKNIFITSPLDLNDPFEMRPAWTQNHMDRHSQGLGGMSGLKGDVSTMMGLADLFWVNDFEYFHENLRILSFVKPLFNPLHAHSVSKTTDDLLWAHYADNFQGVCIIFDTAKISNGIIDGGVEVQYPPTRRHVPPSFYDSARHDHLKRNEYINFLSYKSPSWEHEKEVRMMYDIRAFRGTQDYRSIADDCPVCRNLKEEDINRCTLSWYRDALSFDSSAIYGVVFGPDCPPVFGRLILESLSRNEYDHVKIFWSTFSSDTYGLQYLAVPALDLDTYQHQYSESIRRAKGHTIHRAGQFGHSFYASLKGKNHH